MKRPGGHHCSKKPAGGRVLKVPSGGHCCCHIKASSPAKAGDPVRRGLSVIARPVCTGYPAFAGYDSQWATCFPALLAPNRDREIGGGRATRQPGQVRKEAALTRSGSGRSSVSYLFFRANRAKCGDLARIRFA